MSTQYLRKSSLLIGSDDKGLDVSQLRFRFQVRRGDIQTPNTADIRVYNLSPDTAKKIENEFTRVVLQAGYQDNIGTIFDGTIKQVRQGRESQTDTYVDITAADGDEAYNYSVTAISLAAGQTSPRSQAEIFIRDMARHNVKQGFLPSTLSSNPLPRGKAIYGQTRDALRRLSHNTDTSWSIQDGEVVMIPNSAYIPEDSVVVVTSETGMIGLPEQAANGIKIRILINPMVRIGRIIQIDNASVQRLRYSTNINAQGQRDYLQQSVKLDADGYYYVMSIDYSGDTRGNPWYADLTCLAADATLVPAGMIGRVPIDQSAIKAVKI